MAAPLVSVLMPVYNVAGYLERSIGSVLGQTLKDIELIVVDDGSSDGSADICDRLAAADPRVKVIHKRNAGPAAARNDALDAASGRYLMFCDSDDEYRPDFCRRMVDELEKSGCDAVVCQCDFLVEENLTQAMIDERLGKDKDYFNPEADDRVTEDLVRAFDVNVLLWNKIFRRETVVRHGIRFPTGHEHDDDAFWYQYVMSTESVRRIPDRLYLYRMRLGSIANSYAISRPKNRHDRLAMAGFVQAFAEREGLCARYSRMLFKLWDLSYKMVRGYFDAGELAGIRREIVARTAACASNDYRLIDYDGELVFFVRRAGIRFFLDVVWNRVRLLVIRDEAHRAAVVSKLKQSLCRWRYRNEAFSATPKVSVIVPVFNVAPFLELSVGSLLTQSLRNIEVILVDDGSTDGSGAIADRLAARDGRIRVLHQSNAGAGPARNAGIDVATGDYLFFADPDDFVKPDYLERMVARADSTVADVVVSDYLKFTSGAEGCDVVPVWRDFLPASAYRVPFAAADCVAEGGSELLYALSPMVWHKLYRRSFVAEHGIRFQDVRKFNDMCFALEATCVARRTLLLRGFGYLYFGNRRGSLQNTASIPAELIHGVLDEFERRLGKAGVLSVFSAACADFRRRNLDRWLGGNPPPPSPKRTWPSRLARSFKRWRKALVRRAYIRLAWPGIGRILCAVKRIQRGL